MKADTFLAKSSALLCVLMLSGCMQMESFRLPAPLPKTQGAEAASTSIPEVDTGAESTRRQVLPTLDVSSWEEDDEKRWSTLGLPDGQFELNVESMKIGRFVQVALGDVLGLSFTVAQEVAEGAQTVTLRISEPVSAERYLAMIEQTLAIYEVGIARTDAGLQVLPEAKLVELPPLPIGAVSNLRDGQGRVMTIVPFTYTSPGEALQFAQRYLRMGRGADVLVMNRIRALLVIGLPNNIERFLQVIELLDRPAMSERSLELIRPVYWQVRDLMPRIQDALQLEGIPVTTNAAAPGVFLSPIDRMNALLVSAPDRKAIDYIVDWISTLDTPDAAGDSLRSFVYFVRHTTAQKLGSVLTGVLGEDGQNGLRMVIDETHNSLVFVGSASAYQTAYQLLQQLDIPAKQVLLEVTVADVTLDNSSQLGVDWQYRDTNPDGSLNNLAGTLNGLGVGGSGLTLTGFDRDGLVRARLNALASKGEARILSSPRLLAVDNEEARIQVGTQIAIISQEIADAGTATDGNNVLRSFNYIDTGVILSFTPTVMSGGMVRLQVYQEVSEPGASANNTPPISKRTIDTTLVAESGQTVMLGGLIRRNTSRSDTQVPLFGDIPLLGTLFRNRVDTENATEMIVIITPHVITSPEQADELTEAFRGRLGW